MRYEPRVLKQGYWGIYDNERQEFDQRYLCINAAEAFVVASLKNKELGGPEPEREDDYAKQ